MMTTTNMTTMKIPFLMNMRRTVLSATKKMTGVVVEEEGAAAEEIVEHVVVKGEKCTKRDKRHVTTGAVDAF